MQQGSKSGDQLTSKSFIDSMIMLALLAWLGYTCLTVVSPFLNLMGWGLMLAVMVYPLHQRLAGRMKGRQGVAATALVLIGILALVMPAGMLASGFAKNVSDWNTRLQNNELSIRQPDPGVAEWPVIGERVYGLWSEAADGLPEFLDNHRDEIQTMSRALIQNAKNILGMVLLLVGAMIVSGIMMAWGESGGKAMLRIFRRVFGPQSAAGNQQLAVATIRSVATGVLGVAFIQAVLFGFGFILAGIPAAGVLAMLVLIIGIIQLPALIVALPVIAYLWSGDGMSVPASVFLTIYFLVAGAADNVLKPMLLGRGVDTPMPVILIGALGGMVAAGFIGLFIGAVVLALGYELFMGWVGEGDEPAIIESPAESGNRSD